MTALFRSLLFWLVLSSGAALWWPGEQLGFDPFAASRWLLWTLITITMFSLGSLVRPAELQPLFSKPWWIVLGVATQFTVMPVAAWLATRLIPMNEDLTAGVILVGCVPGAMASNVLTHTAGGSVAYSVSLTTTATLLSPLVVPVVLSLFAVQVGASQLNPGPTSVLLFLTVVLPTIAGYIAARSSRGFERFAGRIGPAAASICLLWIIASVVASNREKLASVQAVLLVALLVVNLVGYLSGYLVGRRCGLPTRYRRALTLEVGMQNAGLGTALAATLYVDQPMATIPTATYTFGCMLTGTILAVGWRRWLPPQESSDGGTPSDDGGPIQAGPTAA